MPNPNRELHTQQIMYIRKTINYNDANIGTGVASSFSIPAGAMVVLQSVRVRTAFNAGTTNAINVGTAAGGSQFFTDAATAGARQPTIANLTFATDQDVFFQYAQTGTVATAGVADIVIGYVPNNDQ